MEDAIDEVMHWFEKVVGQDVRVLITVAAARMDDLLKQMLQSVMLHKGGGADRLFAGDRPLGTFYSRILLAHRLGLIDDDFKSFLQIFRKLRNDAAHSMTPIDINVAPHVNRVQALLRLASASRTFAFREAILQHFALEEEKEPGELAEELEEFRKEMLDIPADETPAEKNLRRCLALAVVNLECGRSLAKPLADKPLCTLDSFDPMEWAGPEPPL